MSGQRPSGMVVTQVVDLGHLLAMKADELDGIARRLAGTVHNVRWFGEAADRFRGDLTYHLPALSHCAGLLRALSQRAFDNARQQQDASQGDGAGLRSGPAPGADRSTDPADWADHAEEIWHLGHGLVEAGIGVMVIHYGVFQPRDAKGRFLPKSAMASPWSRFKAGLDEKNWHALKDKAAVRGSWKAADEFLGKVNLPVTAGLAALGQWQHDADDPSLDNAAKAGRAAVKGGATVAGMWAGAEAGLVAGGAIGSIFPGPGTAIGGVVGSVVGGVAGSQAGAWIGDHLVDPMGKASDAVVHWVGDAGSSLGHDVSKLKFW